MNATAFQEGTQARYHDEECGGLTPNPYTYDGEAKRCWYEGYRYEDDVTRGKNGHSVGRAQRGSIPLPLNPNPSPSPVSSVEWDKKEDLGEKDA